jgi:YidC/Oxa1 family membrane protein insertase
MTDQKNLILAIVLSVAIILAFQFLYELPKMKHAQEIAEQQAAMQAEQEPAPAEALRPQAEPAPGTTPEANELELAMAQRRLPIDNGRLHGSLAVQGGRIDDITLADYHETTNPHSPEIVLLRPAGQPGSYFAEFGWVATDPGTVVPDAQTAWRGDARQLGARGHVAMTWDNGQGLTFGKRISLDNNYMFTIDRSVRNNRAEPVTLHPYALISRRGTPQTMGFYILHEGPIGVFDDKLHEPDYTDLQKEGSLEFDSTGGWLGFSDKYWLTALIPEQTAAVRASLRYAPVNSEPRYQLDYLGPPVTVPPGGMIEVSDHFFAGAKEVDKLDAYAESLGIPLFDRAVDFGWFYFLTKPIFLILDFFYRFFGNYGVAILMLTLIVKLLFFPLANKSYKAMSQMKKLQPEMMKLRERYENDKTRLNQELMALYKREKVNPLSGCVPIVVQIPVFFALYKVLFVSIEMRHAPFFGWIKDLSAPDPTSVFNLFGLMPWDTPAFLTIGVWPLLMGGTMYLQQRLNPQPADPIQAKVMMLLPVMFTFLFATFPAGLVIYWTWNNILSIAQQWVIMKRMGIAHPAS